MLSISTSPVMSRPTLSGASTARFAELVRKIGTSPSLSSKKRRNSARKKLNSVIKEQRRQAKTADLRAVALTLTYRESADFLPKHISSFLDRLRRALKRMGYSLLYAWVLERASRLHYHLVLWLPRGYRLDAAQLTRWWPWGSNWVEACRSIGAWGRYLVKFECMASLPKGARIYGFGGLDEVGRLATSRSTLPLWLLKFLPPGRSAYRHPKCGWVDRTTGENYHSPYVWTPWGMSIRSHAVRER